MLRALSYHTCDAGAFKADPAQTVTWPAAYVLFEYRGMRGVWFNNVDLLLIFNIELLT